MYNKEKPQEGGGGGGGGGNFVEQKIRNVYKQSRINSTTALLNLNLI
jgi:hypothetical protein